MASKQDGFLYEKNVQRFLKKYSVVTNAQAAGGANDRPDIEIKQSNSTKKSGCELKIDLADAGSIVLHNFDGIWKLPKDALDEEGNIKNTPESDIMRELVKTTRILSELNNKTGKWGKLTPLLTNDKAGNKLVNGKMTKDCTTAWIMKNYMADLKKYGKDTEIWKKINPTVISRYYVSKKCHYINFGSHGFYLLGDEDPLGLNKRLDVPIPEFSDYCKNAAIRSRCQKKSDRNYNFQFSLNILALTRSPYNLAPLPGKTPTISKTLFDNNEHNKLLLEAFKVPTK